MIAHNNRFNCWVVGEGAVYFDGANSFATCMDEVLAQPGKLAHLREQGQARFKEAFTWPDVLGQYEKLLAQYLSG